MSERAQYIEKMELQLEKLNKKMLGLETTAQEAKEEARQKYKEEMTELRHKSKAAAAKLEDMRAASVDTWKNMVTDMEEMHDSLTHSFFAMFQVPATSAPEPKGAKAAKDAKATSGTQKTV